MKFSEEHAFGMLIAKYGDEVTSHTTEMARKDILSRLILHTEGTCINPNRVGVESQCENSPKGC